MGREGILLHPPLPVAAAGARGIDASLLGKLQIIAGRDNDGIRNAGHGPLDEKLRHIAPVIVRAGGILVNIVSLPVRQRVEPVPQRIIVMGTRVADTVRRGEVVRKVSIIRAGVKGELQDLHAREAGLGDELPHRIRDHTQILRNDGQRLRSEALLHGREQGHPRSRHPFTVFCRGITEGHRVIRLKAPEMVHPHIVIHGEAIFHPLQPPAVAGLLVRLPVIQRVAPELTGGGKGIGRDSCHTLGVAQLVELEELPVRPGIRTVR